MKKIIIITFFLGFFFGAGPSTAHLNALTLLDESDYAIFEIKESTGGVPFTPSTISEEFKDFIGDDSWLDFEKGLWEKIRMEKKIGTFEIPREYAIPEVVISTAPVTHEDMPLVEADLPYQARLSITGIKSISVKYGYVHFFGDEEERTITGVPAGVTDGFEMDQELKVRIAGTVGEKITVNVNYDDTKPAYDESARRISIIYKGEPDEIIQEAAGGDITLSLPSTKFVGYSKSVFGVRVKGRYKKLNFMAIASQTKGKIDEREFTGQTSFIKKDITDISYIRRKHYSIDIGTITSHLPIQSGSVRVYIDDKDASNIIENNESTMTVTYFASTQTYTGYFYDLVAGRDFYVDNTKGVLTFNRYIRSNYVVAIEYKYGDGNYEVGLVMIKDENETLAYELKNWYNLGATKILREDFVLRFLDLNRKPITLPEGDYIIDYELGILEFTNSTPFYKEPTGPGFQDIYNNFNSVSHYIIYMEYKRIIRDYYLRPNIVRGSERVVMDGRVLTKDVDYIIDYPSGFLTFLKEEQIDETTRILITYEYMPFFGALKDTLLGLRSEYNFSENFFLGGTFLYNWASAPLEIPQIHATPESTLVTTSDFRLKIPPKKYFPFPTSITGEVARSVYNPNTLGKAMIDNMEGVREAFLIPMSADSWRISITPSGTPANPNWLILGEEDVYLSEININVPEVDDEKKKVLILNYNLPATWSGAGDPERSVIYPLSRIGVDLSDKDTVALWVKGDGRGAELQIDFGSISEDADDSGKFKTEDINLNWSLDSGEDVGWNYMYDGSTYPQGANNGRIDTNDLDGDGFLDTIQSFRVFDSLVDSNLRINWTGWRKIIMSRVGTDSDWSAIKHVRLTVKGLNISGNIALTSLEVVGNKWVVGLGTGTLKINAVNNYDDENYAAVVPLEDKIYTEIYEKVGGSGLKKEQSLELHYTNLADGATAYAYMKYPSAVDFSKHKEINFLLYQEDGSGVDFFISIGAGNNFYFKRIKPQNIAYKTWQKFSFRLPEDFEEIGNPTPTNIMEIRVGIINDSGSLQEGKIWINEIHSGTPAKREGYAMTFSFSSSIPGFLNFGGSYDKVDKNFQTIVTLPRNQDAESYSVNAKLTAIKFLPISGSYSESVVTTPPEWITPAQLDLYLTEDDAGKVIKKSGSLGASFSVRRLPALTGSYSESISESFFTGKEDISKSYKGTASYTLPLRLFFLPTNVSGSYRKTDAFVFWKEYKRQDDLLWGFEDTLDETVEYSGSTNFNIFNLLTLKPTYSKNEKYITPDFYSGPFKGEKKKFDWSQSQDIALSSQLNIGWLRPSGSYSIKINENYNFYKVSNISLPANTKDVIRNFNSGVGVGIPVKKLLPFLKPVETLTVNTNFSFDRGEIWKGIESDYYVFNKLDERVELFPSTPTARLETLTRRATRKYTASWSPFAFMNINRGLLNLIGGISSRFLYNYIESKKITKDSVIENFTTQWPDVTITYGKLNKLPFTERFLTDIILRTNYSFKEDLTFSNDEGVDRNLLVRYNINSRFLLIKKYNSFFEFSQGWQKKINLRTTNPWETYSNDITYTGQVKVPLKKLWNLIARYSQTRSWKESYGQEEAPLADSVVYKPSLSFDAIIEIPVGFVIPLIGKEITMTNRLKLVSSLNTEFARSSLNIDKTNTNRYIFNLSAEMDVASNMRFTFGMGSQYLENIEEPANNWISFHLRSELVIRF